MAISFVSPSVLLLLLLSIVVEGANNDLWNYGYTTFNDGRISYGQPNWNAITCEDPATCVRCASVTLHHQNMSILLPHERMNH